MSFRKPNLAAQVAQLRKSFSSLTVGQAQEHIARLNGFPSWNAARAAEKAKGLSPLESCQPPSTPVLSIYPALHHHRHGTDIFLFDYEPSEEDVIAQIECLSSYEPQCDESIEIGCRHDFQVKGSAHQAAQVAEVNVTDFIEYDTPDTVREWRWIQTQASFAHTENGVGPGVWEFMVRADKLRALMNEGGGQVPSLLNKAIEKALDQNPTWVLFHQG